MIRDDPGWIPDPDLVFVPIPDLIQGSKMHRILDPDPQHCTKTCTVSLTL
jgi:hypothetical protein